VKTQLDCHIQAIRPATHEKQGYSHGPALKDRLMGDSPIFFLIVASSRIHVKMREILGYNSGENHPLTCIVNWHDLSEFSVDLAWQMPDLTQGSRPIHW
jgi:hypothetical protein